MSPGGGGLASLTINSRCMQISGVLENAGTGTYEKDEQLWKRRAVIEETGSYGKDWHLCNGHTQSY